jgi:hypothetical protein
MQPVDGPSQKEKNKAIFYALFALLVSSAGYLVYRWDKSLVSGSTFLFVTVLAVFLLLLWPTPKHFRGFQHDVLRDPRSYLVVLTTFVVAVAALLGLVGDKDPSALSKLTLAVLAVVAFAMRLDRHRQDRLVEEIRLVSRNASAIKSYTSWHDAEIEGLIGGAQETIEIVDSYFMEPEWLAPLIQRAIDRGATKLSVAIYMLDPEQDFGAQRLLEQGRQRSGQVADYKTKYDENLRVCYRLIKNQLVVFEERGIKVTAHLYRTMPGLRIIIVDNAEFVFGWFPLGESNPTYTCLHVSERSLAAGDAKAVTNIRKQLREIKEKESREFDLRTFEESTASLSTQATS